MKDSIKRLKEYVEDDAIYQEYKEGKEPQSDFDIFCIQHCQDIECVLNALQQGENDDNNTRND